MASKSLLAGWLPVTIIPEEEELLCRWMFTGNSRFSDPFFSDTLSRCKQFPENTHRFKSVSSLSMLKEWSVPTSLQPAAILFHVSRCGSTTLTQLLDLDPKNRILSEVPLLDEILRLPFSCPDHPQSLQAAEYFRAAVAWYGQPHNEKEKRLYIKTDSWHLHFYPLLRKLYPSTAFIIITRSPAEVLQSQRRQRGIQAVPGILEPAIFGLHKNELSFDLERHMEKVLESYYTRIIQIIREDPHVTIVDYSDGMENMLNKTLQATNATIPAGFEKLVKERLQFDGKNPGMFFNPLIPDVMDPGARCMELYRQCQSLSSAMLPADKVSQQH